MTPDAQAVEVVKTYAHVIDYATAKYCRKWRSYLAAKGDTAPFSYEDIRQSALEALLLMAGLIPGRDHSLSGTLADAEARGGDRFVQRAVDMYVSAFALHQVERARAVRRGGGGDVYSLDRDTDDKENGFGVERAAAETSPEALAGIAEKYPLLYMTKIQGFKDIEAIEIMGLTRHAFQAARAREVEAFTAWAHANRRVAA